MVNQRNNIAGQHLVVMYWNPPPTHSVRNPAGNLTLREDMTLGSSLKGNGVPSIINPIQVSGTKVLLKTGAYKGDF